MANRFTGALSLTLTTSGLAAMTALTDPRLLARAEARAIRAAASTARTQVTRGITSRYTISSARVRKDISKPFITADAATLRLSRQAPSALQYRFKPGRRGTPQPGLGRGRGWGPPRRPGRAASIQPFRNRPAARLPGAFLAKGLPLMRVRRRKGRGSLRFLHGPSIGSIYAGRSRYSQELRETTQAAISQSFEKNFRKAIDDARRGYGRGN